MLEFCYLRLYFAIETVSCRLLQRMARTEMDCNVKMPAKLTGKLLQLLPPRPLMKFVWYLLYNSTRAFCVWVKLLGNDLSTKLS